ncbi:MULTISPECIES: SecY-interacting protein [Arsenophonus]|uniref:SecY-interacting protein n=1 Tax=Arsenophonus TaxID=637 RepID=UPI0015D81F13|nr:MULTISPECIES: SecY-interacting protein [Arsenophonus]UBX29780.1 SecY-interacting protein [Arsenophonus apicola]
METTISHALKELTQRYITYWQQQTGGLPASKSFYSIPSPCIEYSKDEVTFWLPKPFPMPNQKLHSVEKALEIHFYPNIHQFYTTQLAADMRVKFQGRQLDLIQVWNMTDFTRLQENLIGHLITQKRRRLTPTLFIASLDSEFEIISVDNLTGQVILETLGQTTRSVLACNLIEFLKQLIPVIEEQYN